MRVLIVDLYGDGDCLRVFEDTPRVHEVIEAFRAAEKEANDTDSEDYPDFDDFAARHGIRDFPKDKISL